MRNTTALAESLRFQRLNADLAAWRRSARPSYPIPARLWAAAVELARQHGAYRVARALGLCGATLKARMDAGRRPDHRPNPGFIELPAPVSASPTSPVIVELSEQDGARRLRLELRGAAPPELAPLLRELWQVAR